MRTFKTVAFLAVVAVFPPLAVADDSASNADPASGDPAFVVGRPGNAESPVAVPKGYLQVESGLAGYTNNPQPPSKGHAEQFAQTSFRYGLFDATDVQLVVTPYTRQVVHSNGADQTSTGFGSTTLRVLHTFMGADGSSPSFGVIAFVTLPTASSQLKNAGVFDNRVEGGAIATGTISLTDKASLTLTLADDTKHPTLDAGGNSNSAYFNDTYGAANLTYSVTDTLGVYAELYGDHTHTFPTLATVDFGMTYLTGKTTQIDAGVNIAANKITPDASLFVGWSHRF